MSKGEKPAIAEQFRFLKEAYGDEIARAQMAGGEPGDDDAFRVALRAAEALLFASGEAMSAEELAPLLPPGADAGAVLARLEQDYAARGVNLKRAAGKWRFQSAPDLAHLFTRKKPTEKKLSKAALECLGVIAYHQPVTRAEIEDIRGVSLSRGTLDLLLEIGWVRPRGRRRTPGRPLTYATSEAFLSHFGLASLDALPGKEDLKAAGLLDGRGGAALEIPRPLADPDEEYPLDEGDSSGAFFVDHHLDKPEGQE